jgi:hypothetical protein
MNQRSIQQPFIKAGTMVTAYAKNYKRKSIVMIARSLNFKKNNNGNLRSGEIG